MQYSTKTHHDFINENSSFDIEMNIDRIAFMKTISFLILFFSLGFFNLSQAAAEPTWTHTSELGIVVGGGNTSFQTITAKQQTKYHWPYNNLILTSSYLFGSSSGVLTAQRWEIGGRYEYEVSSLFNLFAANQWLGDRFASIDYGTNFDIGTKYFFLKSETTQLFSEGSYRFYFENRFPGSTPRILRTHGIRLYIEGSRQMNESVSAKVWVEGIPDISGKENHLFNFEPSTTILLSSILSLKLAYQGRFDALPAPGKKKFDFLYTTSLVAKL
tara:strand:+ start:679 stop:1494 length:816 start_codon:yes stop_codon:yes gene_type:complete